MLCSVYMNHPGMVKPGLSPLDAGEGIVKLHGDRTVEPSPITSLLHGEGGDGRIHRGGAGAKGS